MKAFFLATFAFLSSVAVSAQATDTTSYSSLNKTYPVYSDKKLLPEAIDQGYILFTYGMDIFTGGTQTPYKKSYFFQDTYGIPVRKNHAFIDIFYDVSVTSQVNTDFYRTNFDTTRPISDINIDPVFSFGLGAGFMPVIVSKNKVAITAGPQIGARLLFLPNLQNSYLNDLYGADNNFQRGNFVSGFWGIKTNFFLNRFVMSFEYCMFGSNKQPITSTSLNSIVDINYNYFRIGIGGHF